MRESHKQFWTSGGTKPWTDRGFFTPTKSDDQVATHCDGGCLGTAGDIQLKEDTGDVESHSGRAYYKLLRYLRVALPLCDQGEYSMFSLCQVVFLCYSKAVASSAHDCSSRECLPILWITMTMPLTLGLLRRLLATTSTTRHVPSLCLIRYCA